MHREQSVKREKTNKMQQTDVYYQLLSQHVSGIIMPIFRRTKTVCYSIPAEPAQYTICSNTGLCSPEDGHNDARNMLRQKLIINTWLLHLVGFLSLYTLLKSIRRICNKSGNYTHPNLYLITHTNKCTHTHTHTHTHTPTHAYMYII